MNSPNALVSLACAPSVGTSSRADSGGIRVPAALAKFIVHNPPHKGTRASRSPLSKYRSEICELTSRGYSLSEIQAFLKGIGLETSRTAIHNFIKKTDKTANNAADACTSETQPQGIDEMTKTAIASAAAEILNIPEVFRGVLVNFSGNTGKTTIARHVFMPVLRNAELIRVETINSSGASEADFEVAGKQFEDVAKKLYEAEHHTLVDVGASNIELVKQVLYRVAGAHRFVDMWVVPCMPNKKMVTDTIATIKELLKIGVPPKNIVVLKNKVNDVDTMDLDFEELTAVTTALKVRLVDRPLLEFDLYSDMDHRTGTLDEVLADQTDYRAQMLAAKKAGNAKAAEDAMNADFRRMNAETAVQNIDNLRRDIFGVAPAPVAAAA